MPHRAHVLRGRPHRRRARDDPRRQRRGPPQGPGQDPAAAAGRLRGHLPGDGRPARHHPPARPAAARVPAARATARSRRWPPSSASTPPRRSRPRSRACTSPTRCSASAAAAWASSTPRSPRCRPARSSRPPWPCKKKGIDVHPEVMIPLVGDVDGAEASRRSSCARVADEVLTATGVKFDYLVGTMIELPRAALHRRRDRRGRRVLQLRHQRPDPDDLRPQPRRRRALPADLRREEAAARRPVPVASTRRASASS